VTKDRSLGGKILFILHLLLWLALVLVAVIAYTPVTHYMLKPLTIQEGIRHADIILVLGGGIDRGGYLSLVSSHRLLKGTQLYFEGRANKILFSGGLPRKVNASEAAVMAQEARRLKIPAGDMFLEKKSKNTHEQAVEVKKMADSLQWKSILLVTSFSHMKRALMTFENIGFKIYPAPADPYEKYTDDPLGRLCLFPVLIHEYLGIVYYKIRGWI